MELIFVQGRYSVEGKNGEVPVGFSPKAGETWEVEVVLAKGKLVKVKGLVNLTLQRSQERERKREIIRADLGAYFDLAVVRKAESLGLGVEKLTWLRDHGYPSEWVSIDESRCLRFRGMYFQNSEMHVGRLADLDSRMHEIVVQAEAEVQAAARNRQRMTVQETRRSRLSEVGRMHAQQLSTAGWELADADAWIDLELAVCSQLPTMGPPPHREIHSFAWQGGTSESADGMRETESGGMVCYIHVVGAEEPLPSSEYHEGPPPRRGRYAQTISMFQRKHLIEAGFIRPWTWDGKNEIEDDTAWDVWASHHSH